MRIEINRKANTADCYDQLWTGFCKYLLSSLLKCSRFWMRFRKKSSPPLLSLQHTLKKRFAPINLTNLTGCCAAILVWISIIPSHIQWWKLSSGNKFLRLITLVLRNTKSLSCKRRNLTVMLGGRPLSLQRLPFLCMAEKQWMLNCCSVIPLITCSTLFYNVLWVSPCVNCNPVKIATSLREYWPSFMNFSSNTFSLSFNDFLSVFI